MNDESITKRQFDHHFQYCLWIENEFQAGTIQQKRETMAIGNAVQKGSLVYIYDEKGKQLATVPAGSGKDDGLKGYTSTTVNVRKGSLIYTYDEKGRQKSTTPAR